MDYENLAVLAVEQSISKTDLLKSYIVKNANDPGFDGYICVFKKRNGKKDELERVDVQVKGKGYLRKVKDTIKFPVSVRDLEIYLKNGGCFYFVVYIDKKTGETLQIYYSRLLPIKIKDILENKNEQETISVKMEKFPEDNSEKIGLLRDYLKHKNKQQSYIDSPTLSIDELREEGILESVTFAYAGITTGKNGSVFFPSIEDGKEMIIYANIKGGASIPTQYYASVDRIKVEHPLAVSIRVGKEEFFQSVTMTHTSKNRRLNIGNCFFSTFDQESEEHPKKPIKVDLTLPNLLSERIQALHFYLALVKEKSYYFGNELMHLGFGNHSDKELTDYFSKKLDVCNLLNRVLQTLNVKKDLDFTDFTNKDRRVAETLIDAFAKNKTIHNEAELPFVFHTSISNINLLLVSQKVADYEYKLYDYYNKKLMISVAESEDGEKYLISQFNSRILDEKSILKSDNINYSTIINDIKRDDLHPIENVISSNLLLMEIIKAYDQKPTSELYDCMYQLAEWLCNKTEVLGEEVALLNYLQVKIRKEKLSNEERIRLTRIAATSKDISFQAGAYILLEDFDIAKSIIDKMPEEAKNQFLSFPIYNLIKNIE